MEIMDTVAYTAFSGTENERWGIGQELEGVFDFDAFIQPGMSEFPLIRYYLESILYS